MMLKIRIRADCGLPSLERPTRCSRTIVWLGRQRAARDSYGEEARPGRS